MRSKGTEYKLVCECGHDRFVTVDDKHICKKCNTVAIIKKKEIYRER